MKYKTEYFASVKGYENSYLISDQGRVFSLKTKKILKVHYGSCGYLNVFLYDGHNKKKTKKIHRLVCEAFLDNPNNKSQVNHKDCNKHNNKLSNLEWVDQIENMRHAKKNGLRPNQKGEKNSFAKLKESDIIKIRNLRNGKVSRSDVANMFGICESHVSEIHHGKVWKHLK